MASKELLNLLGRLDLLSNKTVFFRDEDDGKTFDFPFEIQKKIEIIDPDAFFVFNKQPYILFFDLTEQRDNEREFQIYKQVWSFDYAPLIFIIRSSDIEIFNAFNFDKRTNRLQKIKISDEERDKIFSFWNLQTGESWKWLQQYQYKNIQKKRVNQRLFDNIKEVREKLKGDGLDEDQANILILRLIFIRYLIDRDVKIDETFINGKSIIEKRQAFGQLIAHPRKLNEFFNYLNEKFNGVLFKDIKFQLSLFQATSLSLIFDGRVDKNVPTLFDNDEFFFEIFDFSIIPVEVISGIYESLIDEETRIASSAIYTPSFLVEYMLTETVDKYLYKNKTSECKTFDPACGSGIFLVQSYRRMVEAEKYLQGEKISKTRLREIAVNNLFGIDLNEQALKVTCFSIYIALLDYQDPATILGPFQFPKLIGENLFIANFFDTEHEFNQRIVSENINFILGNPPWKSSKDETHVNWLKKNNEVTGRYEIAQSFLLRVKDFMYPHTVTSLIVTSTIFYNISSTTKEFKKNFLTQFCLDRFFDLSPVRKLIFEEKISPAAILFYRLSDGKKHLTNVVKHLSLKPNIFLKYFKALIVEKFDQKEIQQKHFIENDWMFKVALYGNTLDFVFLKRMHQTKIKINDLVDNNILFAGAGIKSNKG
ncbi:MAG: DNA methyltransferase, partial [Bacteroidota bacterium]